MEALIQMNSMHTVKRVTRDTNYLFNHVTVETFFLFFQIQSKSSLLEAITSSKRRENSSAALNPFRFKR